MPIAEPLKTGDVVSFGDSQWRVKLNGTSVYLREEGPEEGREAKRITVRKRHLLKTGTLAGSPVQRADDPGEVQGPQQGESKARERVESKYFYVVRDIDAASDDRRVKMGISGNVPSTLRTYRRRNPGDQVIFTVRCASESNARALEGKCKKEFAEFRLDKSEVYTVRPHEIIRMLHANGYRQQEDGVFAMMVEKKEARADPKGAVCSVCAKLVQGDGNCGSGQDNTDEAAKENAKENTK